MSKIMIGSERGLNRERIKTMPGWAVHWACVRLMHCYGIFYNNSNELILYSSNPLTLHYYLMPDIKSRVQKNALDCETARLIHNYVASAKTLVDVSRNNSKKFLNPDLKRRYDNAVCSEFANDACVKIIHDLRNFMLHVDAPDISNQINILTGASSHLSLLPERLLSWKNWNKVAKDYLKNLFDKGEKIIIHEFFQEYTDKTELIKNILMEALVESNMEELSEIYDLHDQILEGVKADNYVTDPLFVHFFSRNEQYSEDGIKVPIFKDK